MRGDLARRDERVRIAADARAALGPINALVNNAGRAPRVRQDLLEAQEDSFEELLRANLQGPYFLTQAIARDQVEQRRADPSFPASIVFVTSVSAEMASPNRGEYCVSKAGLSMAARLFAVRLAAARHSRLRSAPRHHRHRHDGRLFATSTIAASPTGSCPSFDGDSPTTWAAPLRRCSGVTCRTPPARSLRSTEDSRYRGCDRN